MTIKSILVPIEGTEKERRLLDAAHQIASQFDAHIDVLHVKLDSKEVVPFVGEGLTASVMDHMVSNVESQENEQSRFARKIFKDFAESSKVEVVKPSEIKARKKVTATYHAAKGRAVEVVPQWGRTYDLILFPKLTEEGFDATEEIVADAAIYETGRPLLFVPEKLPKTIGKKVGIYWNGSIEASRAVESFKQFLMEAKVSVTVFTTDEYVPHGKKLMQYFGLHGVKSEHVQISKEIGEDLIKKTVEHKLDLLVMGAYSHSRLRHMFFGSTTNHVMFNTEVPVLFAH